MKKVYKQIDSLGYNIDEVVRNLLKYKEQGELVSTNFNDHMLYSDTVTLDSAYVEVTGKTKAEFDKAHQDWKDEYDRQQAEHKANIPTLTEVWQQKARTVLTEDKWEFWDKIVPIRLGDLYQGMELGCCLDIVTVLNNGTFEEAKKVIESQGHSGMSWGLVCSMVKAFSDKGEEFVKYVNTY